LYYAVCNFLSTYSVIRLFSYSPMLWSQSLMDNEGSTVFSISKLKKVSVIGLWMGNEL